MDTQIIDGCGWLLLNYCMLSTKSFDILHVHLLTCCTKSLDNLARCPRFVYEYAHGIACICMMATTFKHCCSLACNPTICCSLA